MVCIGGTTVVTRLLWLDLRTNGAIHGRQVASMTTEQTKDRLQRHS